MKIINEEAIVKKYAVKTKKVKLSKLGITVEVKNKIGIDETDAFILELIEALFDKNGDFRFGTQEYMWRLSVITYFTDLEMPNNRELTFNILSDDEIMQDIYAYIDSNTLSNLKEKYYEAVEYTKQIKIAEVACAADKLIQNTQALTDQYNEIMKDIEGSDLKSLIKNFGNLTPENLADAVLKKREELDTEAKQE
jgi:hypothetical protein